MELREPVVHGLGGVEIKHKERTLAEPVRFKGLV